MVAKTRQVSSPTFVRRFKASHSSAQARILSRLARGNIGGGFVVSTGGSGGSLVALSSVGASCGGGVCGVVVGAGAAVAGGFTGADCFAGGFDADGFFAFAAVAAAARGAGAAVCAVAGASASAPARQLATALRSDEAGLPAAVI